MKIAVASALALLLFSFMATAHLPYSQADVNGCVSLVKQVQVVVTTTPHLQSMLALLVVTPALVVTCVATVVALLPVSCLSGLPSVVLAYMDQIIGATLLAMAALPSGGSLDDSAALQVCGSLGFSVSGSS